MPLPKLLPARMREDVEKELHSLISDMLEERCQDMPPTEHDVLVVLTGAGPSGRIGGQIPPGTRFLSHWARLLCGV